MNYELYLAPEDLQAAWREAIPGTDISISQASRWCANFKKIPCLHALRKVAERTKSGQLKTQDSMQRYFTATAQREAVRLGCRLQSKVRRAPYPQPPSQVFTVPNEWLDT